MITDKQYNTLLKRISKLESDNERHKIYTIFISVLLAILIIVAIIYRWGLL